LPIDLAAYDVYENDPERGGWAGLNFLIDNGLCADVQDYFDGLFAGRKLPFPMFPAPAEVVAVITGAGGVPILAHPGSRWLPITDEVLEAFHRAGVRGLECYTSYHDAVQTRRFVEWCQRHDALITGGSDCHGAFAPDRHVGQPPVTLADLRLDELADVIVT
ncbi:MAG: PHP domain-containing protein, partial [Chloroflexi bacterium]|nr:PHP domain-containing protein [Chloroflexota bacterium]